MQKIALVDNEACFVCERIRLTQAGNNPNLVKELSTGYVVLGDDQYIHGYTLFLCKTHAVELFELESEFQARFMKEMVLTAQAVANVFHAEKMNYELLGMGKGIHMHWHLFPRRRNDTPVPGPVWRTPKEVLGGPESKVQPEQRKRWIEALRNEIERLLESGKPA